MVEHQGLEAAKSIADVVNTVGVSVVVILFFLWKDYKLAERQTVASEKIAANLALLNHTLDSQENDP